MATKKKSPSRSKPSSKKVTPPTSIHAAVKAAVAGLKEARKHAPVTLLTSEERRALSFPRDGAEVHIRRMEDVLAEFPEQLAAAAVAAGDLSDAWTRAEALAPLQAELAGFAQAVEDTIKHNRSVAWKGALDILAAARAAARKNADIREAIADTEQFLKTGPRAGAKPVDK
jgi:hypothetical protein